MFGTTGGQPQNALFGSDDGPRPTDRLFFAIKPDAVTAAVIEALAQGEKRDHGLSGRLLRPENLHSTLHHLGDYVGLPADIVERARSAGARVSAAPFDVSFDRVANFARPRNLPLVLRGGDGVAGLIAFQRLLGQAMRASGLARRVESQYTPHVTLMYDDRRVGEHSVAPIGWTVTEFMLVHSLLGQTRHIVLDRWTLASS